MKQEQCQPPGSPPTLYPHAVTTPPEDNHSPKTIGWFVLGTHGIPQCFLADTCLGHRPLCFETSVLWLVVMVLFLAVYRSSASEHATLDVSILLLTSI